MSRSSRQINAILGRPIDVTDDKLQARLAEIDKKIRQIKLDLAQIEFLVKEIRNSNR